MLLLAGSSCSMCGVALPGVGVKVVDDKGQDAPCGAIGEIWVEQGGLGEEEGDEGIDGGWGAWGGEIKRYRRHHGVGMTLLFWWMHTFGYFTNFYIPESNTALGD